MQLTACSASQPSTRKAGQEPNKICAFRAQAKHFVQTGELPVDGEAAPRKALPAVKKEQGEKTQAITTAGADPIMARLERIKELKDAGISDELIALALKG